VRVTTYLGLFLSLIGFWLIATVLYAIAAILGADLSNPWSALIYTTAQLVSFLILLRITRSEGGFSTIYFGGRGFRELAIATPLLAIAIFLYYPLDLLFNNLNLPPTHFGYKSSGLGLISVGIWAVGAAFFEEAFYRGYAITRLASITHSLVVSSVISIVFFSLIHLMFGVRLFLYMLLIWGPLVTLTFLLARSTWASFYFHLINNVLVDFVFPVALTG